MTAKFLPGLDHFLKHIIIEGIWLAYLSYLYIIDSSFISEFIYNYWSWWFLYTLINSYNSQLLYFGEFIHNFQFWWIYYYYIVADSDVVTTSITYALPSLLSLFNSVQRLTSLHAKLIAIALKDISDIILFWVVTNLMTFSFSIYTY